MVFPAKRFLLKLDEEEKSVRRRPTSKKEKVFCMIMDDLCICKICKKLFSDMQGLKKHQMTHHSNPTFGDNSKEIPHQFRNNNSISITRIQKEPSANVQSAIMQNQNSFRRMASAQPVSVSQSPANIRRNEIGKKVGVGDGRAKPPIRSPDIGTKNAPASLRSMAPGIEVDDDTWQKWEPAHRDRDNGVANTDGTIITSSAAERATSAFCSSSPVSPRVGGGGARKGVPQLLRMVSSNGKRPAPGASAATQRTNPASGGVRGAASTSPVADIMQNLGKIKSLNAQANRPNPKMISVPPPVVVAKKVAQLPKQKAPQPVQPFRVNKPPHVSKAKQKILPRNAYNNALPKPDAQKAPRLHVEDEEVDEDEDLMEDEEDDNHGPSDQPPKLQLQSKNHPQSKTAAAPKTSGGATAGGGGKAPPQKSLNKNRFNPVKNTKGNAGEATSKNGKSSPDNAKSATKEPAPVVAKKSAPGRKPASASTNKLMKMKMYVPKMPGTKYDMPSLNAVSSYTSRNGDQIWICLVCNDKESEESSRDMICCDSCEDWYHWECVGIFSSMPEDDPWYCKRCIFNASSDPKKNFPTIFKSNAAP